eukprot:1955564-Pyramimonas_sp.AAC.1
MSGIFGSAKLHALALLHDLLGGTPRCAEILLVHLDGGLEHVVGDGPVRLQAYAQLVVLHAEVGTAAPP